MKLHTIETPVESSGNLQISSFSIAASAKAFKILSSNLYSNKVRAVIRELSCNAYDSHVAAGCPEKPFDIHLPTALNEQFIVRDYGVGLSHDDIMGLYTTYFASTKSDSNDYIGALGLGSKSPFAYTDTFGVTSFFNGMSRTYSVFIKDGEPSITIVHECQTDQPNGLEVAVPVAAEDIREFRDESRYVFSVFKTKPNMRGTPVAIPEIKVCEDFQSWFLGKSDVYTSESSAFAIMGNVIYPIKPQYLDDYPKYQAKLREQSIFVVFALGELDITPSREELSYDDQTVENIKRKFTEVSDKIKESYVKSTEGLTNRQALRKLKEISGSIRNMSNHDIVAKTLGREHPLYNWITSLRIQTSYEEYYDHEYFDIDGNKKKEVRTRTVVCDYETYKIYEGNITRLNINRSQANTMNASEPMLYLIYNDLQGKSGIRRSILQYLIELNKRLQSKLWSVEAVVYHDKHKIAIDRMKATFDASEIIEMNASTLLEQYTIENKKERKPVVRKQSIEVERIVLDKSRNNGIWDSAKFTNYQEFLEKASGLVMTSFRDVAVNLQDVALVKDSESPQSLACTLVKKKIINDVWLIPREQRERTKKAIDSGVCRLIDISDYLNNLVTKVANDPNKVKDLISKQLRSDSGWSKLHVDMSYAPDTIANKFYDRFKSLYQLQEVVDKDSLKVYNIREYTKFESAATKQLAEQIETISNIEMSKIDDAYNTTMSRYPLVSALCTNRHRWNSNTIVEALNYMENIDNGYFANY